ncbi:Hypothetical protein Minf_0976 [Methylacidiphilum infernorum V4]|uniref:Uncharacterized protein n=1 Tax=Methylacidiphilum infernorum (isolate V4) TaxID=481448 RepID=B3DUM8_METI4|nr:Hypothetical protein Minf_0976 [Methylacidiphilum infernorum V4]
MRLGLAEGGTLTARLDRTLPKKNSPKPRRVLGKITTAKIKKQSKSIKLMNLTVSRIFHCQKNGN